MATPVWKKTAPALIERAPSTVTLVEASAFEHFSIDTKGMGANDKKWVEESVAALKTEGLTSRFVLLNVPLPEGLSEDSVAFRAPRTKSEKVDEAPPVVGYAKVDSLDAIDAYGRGWLLYSAWLSEVLELFTFLEVQAWFSNRADSRFPVAELRLEAPPEAGWRAEAKAEARERWNSRKPKEPKSEPKPETAQGEKPQEPATF